MCCLCHAEGAVHGETAVINVGLIDMEVVGEVKGNAIEGLEGVEVPQHGMRGAESALVLLAAAENKDLAVL